MSTPYIISFSGLIFNIIGTLILTFSLSNYLTALHGTAAIHDMQLQFLLRKRDRLLDADVGNLLKKGVKSNVSRTKTGLWIIIIGFIIQLVPYIFELLSLPLN